MTDLFLKNDIGIAPLVNYVSWYIDKNNENYQLIQLPSIQRNAVWNTYQIELLWDSILRGFPIGSFLLSDRNAGNQARGLLSGDLLAISEKQGYYLLDGQQRTRAILLGFVPDPCSRLWIDLDTKFRFEDPAFNNRKFLLRLTTKDRPWGMDDRYPKVNLPDAVKRDARLWLYGNAIRDDKDIPINKGELTNNQYYSYPMKSTLPVPFDILIKLCGGLSGKFVEPAWEDVWKFVPQRFAMKTIIKPPSHFRKILEALRNLIESSDNRSTRSVVFLKQNEEYSI
jgi:hypothetical protein